MQPGQHHEFSHPLSIHLEPDDDLNSSVTVEFSVEQVPCVGDPKVSCYKSNGCIVFEGYCPIDSQLPFSECGIRNIKTDSKQKQNIPWTKESGEKVPPYSPFMNWDAIPKFLHDIINGAGLKMSEQKNQYTERDRPTLIFPRIAGQEGNAYSSDEISVTNDPFQKRQWKTVGNIADPKKAAVTPVIIDNIQTKSSEEALPDAADLVTQRKWERRGALPGKTTSPLLQELAVPEGGGMTKERVSAVLAAYTKSVPLKRKPPEEHHIKRDIESTSASVSSTDTADVEVDASEEDAGYSHGSSEMRRSLADAAVGTDCIDEDASECILCGSPLHHRRHDQTTYYAKGASATGESPRGVVDTQTSTSTAEHIHKPKHKSMNQESTVYTATNHRGHRSRETADVSIQAPSTRHAKHSKAKTMRQEDAAHLLATSLGQQLRATMEMSAQASHAGHKKHSKEKTMKQDITAFPVTTNQGQQSAEMFASAHAPPAEHKQHPKEKHTRSEITAYPVETYPSRVSRDAGTSTVLETEMPNTYDDEQEDVAAYPLSHRSSSVFNRNSKPKDDFTRCTMQHIVFPKNNCPYSPSLTSLPLDESDIEYIIRRAKLAKSTLPADKSLCPTERWQLRGLNRTSSKSGRSRSSG